MPPTVFLYCSYSVFHCAILLSYFGSVWIQSKTYNWKHCSKIIFKCVNITVGPIFNEKIAEKWCLWILWTVHGCTIHAEKSTKSAKKKNWKRRKCNPNRTFVSFFFSFFFFLFLKVLNSSYSFFFSLQSSVCTFFFFNCYINITNFIIFLQLLTCANALKHCSYSALVLWAFVFPSFEQ